MGRADSGGEMVVVVLDTRCADEVRGLTSALTRRVLRVGGRRAEAFDVGALLTLRILVLLTGAGLGFLE